MSWALNIISACYTMLIYLVKHYPLISLSWYMCVMSVIFTGQYSLTYSIAPVQDFATGMKRKALTCSRVKVPWTYFRKIHDKIINIFQGLTLQNKWDSASSTVSNCNGSTPSLDGFLHRFYLSCRSCIQAFILL